MMMPWATPTCAKKILRIVEKKHLEFVRQKSPHFSSRIFLTVTKSAVLDFSFKVYSLP